MTSSRERILAHLSQKENVSPGRKRSSDEAFPLSSIENGSKKRTVDSFQVPHVKSKSIFPRKSTDKNAAKKQTSIKKFYRGEKENSSSKRPKLKIYDETKKEDTAKTKVDEGLNLMCAEEPPEKYWELLAEERRKGLAVALKENDELAEEIRAKDDTIRELRTEVEELTETAKHAEYLASVLEELGKECDILPTDEDTDEQESNCNDNEDEVFPEKEISNLHPSQTQFSLNEEEGE